jgi:hypothetical protein
MVLITSQVTVSDLSQLWEINKALEIAQAEVLK